MKSRCLREGQILGALVVVDVLLDELGQSPGGELWCRVRCDRQLGGCGVRFRIRASHLVCARPTRACSRKCWQRHQFLARVQSAA